ncbi:hypothetical protein C8Q78DRAFT_689854 [Trametes maxima]|nr:hypothetical protein C8Q78DRAFT_689854 [Trametes maxima]
MADDELRPAGQEQDGQPLPRQEGQPQQANDHPVQPLVEARNPFRMQRPDYRAFEWDDERGRLVREGTVANEEQAVARLEAQWQDKIQRAKEDWVRRGGAVPQADEGADRGRDVARDVNPQSRATSPTVPSEHGDPSLPLDPTRKKKYVPIQQGRMGPDTFVDPPSQFAQSKLRKWDYIELSYFTIQERERAKRHQLASNDDILSIERGGGSLMLASAAQASKDARSDTELSWEEVMQARGPFMEWLEKLGWPRKYIEMHATFFWRLDAHELRSRKGGTDALVRYQAKYRREWHISLENGEPFDLSVINEDGLAGIRAELLREQLEESVLSNATASERSGTISERSGTNSERSAQNQSGELRAQHHHLHCRRKGSGSSQQRVSHHDATTSRA